MRFEFKEGGGGPGVGDFIRRGLFSEFYGTGTKTILKYQWFFENFVRQNDVQIFCVLYVSQV